MDEQKWWGIIDRTLLWAFGVYILHFHAITEFIMGSTGLLWGQSPNLSYFYHLMVFVPARDGQKRWGIIGMTLLLGFGVYILHFHAITEFIMGSTGLLWGGPPNPS